MSEKAKRIFKIIKIIAVVAYACIVCYFSIKFYAIYRHQLNQHNFEQRIGRVVC